MLLMKHLRRHNNDFIINSFKHMLNHLILKMQMKIFNNKNYIICRQFKNHEKI